MPKARLELEYENIQSGIICDVDFQAKFELPI